MSIIRYGGTSGGYRTIKQFGRDPFLGYTLEDLAQLVKGASGVLYLDARKADGVNRGINSPLTNPLIDLTKLGNNATLTNFAATQTDGYTLEATVNSNGQAVEYDSYSPNGDFSNGITGYTPITGLGYSIALNEMTITNLTADAAAYKLIYRTAGVTIGKRYYSRVIMKTNSNLDGLTIAGNSGSVTVKHSGGNNYELLSAIGTASATGIGDFRPLATSRTGDISANPIKIKEFIIINLTDNPQIQALETALGRQLTALECDRIFPFVATTGTTLVSARPYLATEGLDSLGTIANNPSVDIVGTGSFAYATGFITPTTIVTGALYFDGNNGSVLADRKICPILNSDGSLTLTLEGTSITLSSAGTIKPNTYCDVRIIRDLGVLKCTINGLETYSVANTTNLVTKTHKRLFAITTNVGGTTHGTYLKVLSSHEVLASGSDVSKLNGVLDKIVKDYK